MSGFTYQCTCRKAPRVVRMPELWLSIWPNCMEFTPASIFTPPSPTKQYGVFVTSAMRAASQKEIVVPIVGGLPQAQSFVSGLAVSSWLWEINATSPKTLIGKEHDQHTSVT